METLTAYYCFVNLGWPPSKFDELPHQEKLMVTAFALRDMKARKAEMDRMEKR